MCFCAILNLGILNLTLILFSWKSHIKITPQKIYKSCNLIFVIYIQLEKLIHWSFCSMFPQLSMKYEGVLTGIKYFVRNHIISLHSSICPWNMSLFISPELPLFYISKMRFEVIYNFIWLSEFLFPSNKTFLLCTKSFFFWPAAVEDVTSWQNCMKKISFQSAHWRKWMKWDWWKLFKDSIRQNCNLGRNKVCFETFKRYFSRV